MDLRALSSRELEADRRPAGEEVEFELWQDGEMVAGAWGPRDKSLAEMRHYAMVYGQDGPVEVFEVRRIPVDLSKEP